MGRPRKPTKLILLKGADKANPARYKRQGRDKEPRNTDPLPQEAPEWMDELQQEYYLKVLRIAHKDVLCVADEATVSMVAVYWAELETTRGNLADRKVGKLLSCLDRLGMTPSARSKVQAIPRDEKEDDKFAEFGT